MSVFHSTVDMLKTETDRDEVGRGGIHFLWASSNRGVGRGTLLLESGSHSFSILKPGMLFGKTFRASTADKMRNQL